MDRTRRLFELRPLPSIGWPVFPVLAVCLSLGCGGGVRRSEPASTKGSRSSENETPSASPTASVAPWAGEFQQRLRNADYRISPNLQGMAAVNPQQGLRASWAGGLLTIRGKDPKLSGPALAMRAAAVSQGGRKRGLVSSEFGLGECRADGAKDEAGACLRRIERQAGLGVTEWWENRPDGLEHGFVVDKPMRTVSGRHDWLGVEVQVRGATVELAEGNNRARLTLPTKEKLDYAGLVAWDSKKKPLPVRMRLKGSSLWLEVDDNEATYPVTIDPILNATTWTVASGQNLAGYQTEVTGAGDVDGNGYDDVLVRNLSTQTRQLVREFTV